jgi:iron complex transport system ATP-binding protein
LSLWGRLSAEDNARVNAAMSQTRIHHLSERRLTELSGGQRQRAFLAMVLAQNTSVVLLDEPTTYLDINHQVELMRLMGELRDQGKRWSQCCTTLIRPAGTAIIWSSWRTDRLWRKAHQKR